MPPLHNDGSNCGLRFLILGMATVTICYGFLSPERPLRSCISKKRIESGLAFARKIPEFSVDDDDDDKNYGAGKSERPRYEPPSFTVDRNDSGDYQSATAVKKKSISNNRGKSAISSIRRPRRMKRVGSSDMTGTSWMDKNAKFSNGDASDANTSVDVEDGVPLERPRNNKYKRDIGDSKTFREEFQQTRVFVQGIPPGVSWQDLKDHFREAGNVVFASISVDPNTGESKGHGIVQFETTAMAQNAIQIMRNYPLNGSPLFVRADVKQNDNPNARLQSRPPRTGSSAPPTKWKCANEDNAEYMSEEELVAIKNLIRERDDARKRRKYDVSDRLRDDLKIQYGVFIDDRLKMWWTSVDGKKVPQSIQDVNGEGRWNLNPWRQIPTTPENDACINPDMVTGLLKQRDIARREKDFKTADMLLEQARTSPDGNLELRIHDESRTWRAWTESRPPVGQPYEQRRDPMPVDPAEAKRAAARECVAIVKEHAPNKMEEIINVLKKFPGREFQVLKRLKQQYL